MADKRVIVLTHEGNQWQVVLWAVVPTARRAFYAAMQPQATWKSAYPDVTIEEQTKLHAGELAEKVETYARSGGGVQAAQTDLENLWNDYQRDVNNYNPWNRYATYWDGTAWVLTTVA